MMYVMLDHIDARYGSVEQYLRGSGLSSEDVELLRQRLLDT
jgi:protein tyrosine/serine phosphatase